MGLLGPTTVLTEFHMQNKTGNGIDAKYVVSLVATLVFLIYNQHKKIKSVITPSRKSDNLLLLKCPQNSKNFHAYGMYIATHYGYAAC